MLVLHDHSLINYLVADTEGSTPENDSEP